MKNIIRKSLKFVVFGLSIIMAVIGIKIYYIKQHNHYLNNYSDSRTEYLEEGIGCDIMLYGDDFEFTKFLKTRWISNISLEELSKISDAAYHALIINDCSGKLKISDEEWLIVKEICEKNGYDMYYMGNAAFDTFVRLGFSVRFDENEFSFQYIGSNRVGKYVQQNQYGNLYAVHLVDEYIVNMSPEFIVSEMYDCLVYNVNNAFGAGEETKWHGR